MHVHAFYDYDYDYDMARRRLGRVVTARSDEGQIAQVRMSRRRQAAPSGTSLHTPAGSPVSDSHMVATESQNAAQHSSSVGCGLVADLSSSRFISIR